MKTINGYDLSHRFFEWAFEHRQEFKPTVSALYFYLVEVCNKLGWKNEFSISAKECMEGMGVSGYNTYKNAFDILCDNGFIKIVKKSCNHYQANIITLSNFNKVTDILPNKETQEYRESNSESNGDILKTIKPINNKTNKQESISSSLEIRINNFRKSLTQHEDKYPKQMIEDFFNYWSELNQSKTKMKFEMQKTWETAKRLATWSKKSFDQSYQAQDIISSLSDNEKESDYGRFLFWIKDNTPNILKIQTQISEDQFKELKKRYDNAQIINVLREIDNWAEAPRVYTNVYHTFLNKAGKLYPGKRRTKLVID